MVPGVKKDKKLNENTAFEKILLKKDKKLNEKQGIWELGLPKYVFSLSFFVFVIPGTI